MSNLIVRTAQLASIGLLVVGLAHAAEPADAALNPVTGAIELIDTVLDQGQLQIRYVEQPEVGAATAPRLLSDSEDDDLGPRIDVNADGHTEIVWWRGAAASEVFYRVKDVTTGSWSEEIRISAEGAIASHPEITHDGSTTWIVYQTQAAFGTQIEITRIDDGPQPIPPGIVIASTGYGGDLDVQLQSESGHVWVTWIDGATEVAWSRYDPHAEAWSVTAWESAAGSSVEAARAAIRSAALSE